MIDMDERIKELEKQLGDEIWKHAACLSMAEGCPAWNEPTKDDSPAMIAVRTLREKCQQLEARENRYIEHNYVNATPDGGYALRILQSYRDLCNLSWSDVLGGEPTNPLCIEMNKVNEARKAELDQAIQKLRGTIVPEPRDAEILTDWLYQIEEEYGEDGTIATDQKITKLLRRYLAAIEGKA